MASPQPDKFTKISNELFDAIIAADLGKRQLKVVLYVLRKTYGYNKKTDAMSYGNISRATGIDRRHVMRAITDLDAMGVLRVLDSDVVVRGQRLKNIGINKDYEQWLTSGQNSTRAETATSGQNSNSTSGQNSNSTSGQNSHPQKTTSKRQLVKEKIDLFERWYQSYPRKVAKGQARKAFARINPDEAMVERMVQAVSRQEKARAEARSRGEWVPDWKHPATWLNAESWEDEVAAGAETPDWMREAI